MAISESKLFINPCPPFLPLSDYYYYCKTKSYPALGESDDELRFIDLFYETDDYKDTTDHMYGENVAEATKRERDIKELRLRKNRKWWHGFCQCFEFLSLKHF